MSERISNRSLVDIVEVFDAIDITEAHMAYIGSKVLKGLQYIHAQNRIHGDIKSDNIYLTGNGDVKLLDFGRRIPSPATNYREDEIGVNFKVL